jgi:mannose-6-phosphate isomerase-like protein (cupin superfamily)
MEMADLAARARYAPEKMQKVGLFDTQRSMTDLYCLGPGQGQRPHVHAGEDKVYVVLEGHGDFRVGGEQATLGPGHAVLARAGVEHGVNNPGPANLRLLIFIAPPIAH